MAYRHTGDPSWYELQALFGPYDPSVQQNDLEVIVLSSEESEEDLPPVRAAPRIYERESTTLVRSIQMSIWDFVAYASDDEMSLETRGSTSWRKAIRPKKKASSPTIVMKDPKPGHSSASSCASNDPFGKRPMPWCEGW